MESLETKFINHVEECINHRCHADKSAKLTAKKIKTNNTMVSKLNIKQSLIAGLLAGITSSVINAILFLIFHSTGVISDTIYPQPDKPMTIVPVIMASIVPSVIGSLVFFLFEKFTNNGYRIFSIVAIVLMVLSLYSPFTVIPGVTTAYSLVLCVMHLVVPLILLYFIRRAKKMHEIKSSRSL